MAFGLNRAEVIGRLGGDVSVNHLSNGGKVANLSIATDEGYLDKRTGERVDRTEWHRIVTFPAGAGGRAGEARDEGPAGLRLGQAADAEVAGQRGRGPVLDGNPHRPRRAGPVPRQAEGRRRPGGGERPDGARPVGRLRRRHPVLADGLPSSLPPSGAGAARRRSPFLPSGESPARDEERIGRVGAGGPGEVRSVRFDHDHTRESRP